MAQKQIEELSELLTAIENDDVFIVNNDGETKKIKASLLAWELVELFASEDPAGLHKSLWRGKYLGSSVTKAQYEEIKNGTFHDLWLGDYWTINKMNYRIGDINYWLGTGDVECTQNHLLIIPDKALYNAQMNTTNTTGSTTEGAYVGSEMYKTNLATAKATINAAFGEDHILNHRELFATNLSADGDPTGESGGAWYDSTVDLMNEIMVYGCNIFHNVEAKGNPAANTTIDKTQIRMFKIAPEFITTRAAWWLRDVVSSTRFAHVSGLGTAINRVASNSYGVRLAFGIIG